MIFNFSSNLSNVKRNTIEFNTLNDLMTALKWTKKPILKNKSLYKYRFVEDANDRPLKDAQVLGAIARNMRPKNIVEIGTAEGYSTALLADNAPYAKIHTVNILPEDIKEGKGGELITKAFAKNEIGRYYKKQNYKNITQIFADTKTWDPSMTSVDLAFIDGCHDSDYIVNDTQKLLPLIKKGGVIVWHDMSLDHIDNFPWIKNVCLGIEILYKKRKLKNRLFHVRDSWMGVYVI